MTDNQRENLLKAILNKPEESQNENVPTYSDPVVFTNNLANRFTEHFEYPFYATPYRIINKDKISIGFNNESVVILEYTTPTYMHTQDIWFTGWSLIDMIADDNGFYGITINNNKVWLVYFEDITKKDENGNRNIKAKMSYDITSMLTEVTGDSNPQNSAYNGAIKIHKSPIDGRFLIVTSLLNQTYFSVIEYTINVGSANTYRYQRYAKSSIVTDNPIIDDMFVSWTENNVSYAVGIIGKSAIIQSKSNLRFYEITGNMSSISCEILSNKEDIICAPLYLKVAYTPQIRYRSLTERYISYAVVRDTSQVIDGVTWYPGEVVIHRHRGNAVTELSRTATDYMISNQSSSYKNEADIIILNDNVFIIETILTAPDKIQATFKQLIGNTFHSKVVLSNKDYARTGLAFTVVSNEYNLYRYSYQLDNQLYSISSVFRPSGYNGTPYYSKKSLTPVSGQLYDITSNVVFARDLYNKSIVGDTINSIVHVPANYLNENPIIEEKLISDTNETIDETNEEIVKNEYEELYVNFIDTFKVWDKNDKSTYQQNASYQLAKQITTGIEMYVATFRITNNDNTIVESTLGEIPIVDGEGVIDIAFQVPEGGSKTFEIYNQDYSIQFATIDISSLTPGAYKLQEKIKVEG